MCQRIGLSPISTIGLGRTEVSSEILVPNPPANITAFMQLFLFLLTVVRATEMLAEHGWARKTMAHSFEHDPARERRSMAPCSSYECDFLLSPE